MLQEEAYIMYLRKSRMDTDFDEVSVEETLNRHKSILQEFSERKGLIIAKVLEEVVSKRVMANGQMVKKRELNKDYLLFEGRHEAIITQEQWDRVREVQRSKQTPSVRRGRTLANPFANILVCEKCGYAIKRNTPSATQLKTRTFRPWYRCSTKGCECMISYCDVLESKIVEAMRDWWKNISLTITSEPDEPSEAQRQLLVMKKQIQVLQDQQNKICSLLEKGIYTEEMFIKRNTVLADEIRALRNSIEEVTKICDNKSELDRAKELFLPATLRVLDYYEDLTAEEKNRLWKLLMKKITYFRDPTDPNKIEIRLYPKLGRFLDR